MFCPKCGIQNADGAKFCVGCGAPLGTQQQTQPPQQQYQQPQQQYQPQYQQTMRAAATGTAKKAGGGLARKIIVGALIVAVGGAALTGVTEMLLKNSGGGTESTGNMSHNTGTTNTGTSNNSSTTISTANTGSANSTTSTAEGVTLSIPKTVYEPKESITVSYSGVSDEMISNDAWIGMAGRLNAASEHLNQGDYVRHESGNITMKAPNAPGTYQVRFFRAQGATEENYVPDASVSFTVKGSSATQSDDFTVQMVLINEFIYEPLDKRPKATVTFEGGALTVQVDAVDYNATIDGTRYECRIDAVTMTGEAEDSEPGVDFNGDRYMGYTGLIDAFSSFHYYDIFFNDSTGGTEVDAIYRPDPSVKSNFSLRVYENGRHEIQIWIWGGRKGVTKNWFSGPITTMPTTAQYDEVLPGTWLKFYTMSDDGQDIAGLDEYLLNN